MPTHHCSASTLFPGVLRRWLFLLLLANCIFGMHAFCSANVVSKEYQIKATYIHNFTKFIVWPSARASGPLIIGVLGRNPFGDELDKVVQARVKGGREIQVHILKSAAEASSVTLLFVPAGEESKVAGQLNALHQAAVLTVGETPEFSSLGGIITFSKQEENIRFEINREAGAGASLKISPQLLKLALSARQGIR